MTGRLLWEHHPRLDRRLEELRAEHAPADTGALHRQIAETLTDEFPEVGRVVTEDMVRNRLKRQAYQNLVNDVPVTVLMPYFEKYRLEIEGRVLAPNKVVAERTFPQHLDWMRAGQKKTLVLSDLHIPLQDDALIQYAVERHVGADLVVLNGDVGDLHALSTFIKTEDVPIHAELDGLVRFLEWISQTFAHTFVVVTVGNHEDRVQKRMLPNMPAGLEFLLEDNLLLQLARPFPNIVVLDDWFVQIGDAIYAHAAAASSVQGRPATDTLDWFINHKEELALPDFTFVVQAHTHRIAVIYRGKYKAVESGCLCRVMRYTRTTRSKHPQMTGFVVAVQQDGVTNFHLSREYPLARV